MTKKAVEENENVGKMDWDVMNKVLKNTINLDDEGTLSYSLYLMKVSCLMLFQLVISKGFVLVWLSAILGADF